LEIDVSSIEGVNVIKLRGKLGMGEALDKTSRILTELINAGETSLLLDLQQVPMVDSSGIGLLVRFLTTVKQRGGTLKLLNPSKFALQTLKMVKVLNLFEVFEDEAAAVASFD
jgi:anti-sigma B factor antagonist